MARWIAPVLALAAMLWSLPADAQAPADTNVKSRPAVAAAPAAPISKREIRKQRRAAKKVERTAIRKRRVECYDQAQKQRLNGQPLVDFVRSCTAKPN